MLVKKTDDWKQLLGPEDEGRLNGVLKDVQKHRAAYRQSKDIKVAQLWSAVLELTKENKRLHAKMDKMKYVFDGMTDRIKEQQKKDQELIESLESF